MIDTEIPPLSAGFIDRDAATRTDSEKLDAAWKNPQVRTIRVSKGLVAAHPDTGALEWVGVTGERQSNCFYIGTHGETPIFAIVESEPVSGAERVWVHPFTVHSLVSAVQREALTVALALANWHQSAAFSPVTGEPTTPILAGWARTDMHGAEHFPRTDPAVIVCVEHRNRLLLGSNVLWESGRFSLLAGFVEAGESAEQAVVREVREEAGVSVTNVQYVASQPWPYPRSLMLGFTAQLASDDLVERLVADPTEISELRWFSREQLTNLDPGVKLPQPISIARWLIDRWIELGDNDE